MAQASKAAARKAAPVATDASVEPAAPAIPVLRPDLVSVSAEDSPAAPTAIMMPAPRGKPASGRSWKPLQPKKFSSQLYEGTPTLRKSWEQKQAERRQREHIKELQTEIDTRKRQRKEEEKAKVEEKRRRRAEAELKATKYQTISDPTKLKKMNKRQLRQVRKMRVGKGGQVEIVSPWA